MGFRIRQTSDIPTVQALNQILFPETQENCWPGGVFWLARDEAGEPVGWCSLYPSTKEQDSTYLHRYGLLISARGKGLGKRFLKKAVDWSKQNGYGRVVTYTWNENVPSRRAMLAAGFLPYYPEDNLWAGPDVLYYERKL